MKKEHKKSLKDVLIKEKEVALIVKNMENEVESLRKIVEEKEKVLAELKLEQANN